MAIYHRYYVIRIDEGKHKEYDVDGTIIEVYLYSNPGPEVTFTSDFDEAMRFETGAEASKELKKIPAFREYLKVSEVLVDLDPVKIADDTDYN